MLKLKTLGGLTSDKGKERRRRKEDKHQSVR